MSIFTDMIKWGAGRLKATLGDSSTSSQAPKLSIEDVIDIDRAKYGTYFADWTLIATTTVKIGGQFKISVKVRPETGSTSVAALCIEIRNNSGTVVDSAEVTWDGNASHYVDGAYFTVNPTPFTKYYIYVKSKGVGRRTYPTSVMIYSYLNLSDIFVEMEGARDE